MAFIFVNIPLSSLGEVKSQELQLIELFGKAQKKMEENPTSPSSNNSGDQVKPQEQLKSFGKDDKKMIEKAISSTSNHSEDMEFPIPLDMQVKLWTDRVSEFRHLLVVKSKCKIYRVHGRLRNINDKAYEPEVIAIGPYHHGKDNLKMMEYHKWRYFINLIDEQHESPDKYYSAIRPLEREARTCYADPISLTETNFIKMLILDGCFIIELARKINRNEDDPITCMSWMINSLKRDLMLFENQIPFFVLCKLFDLIEGPNQRSRLIDLLTGFFRVYICLVKVDRDSSNRSLDEHRNSSIGFLTRFFRNISHAKEDKESSNRCQVEKMESSNRHPVEDIEISTRCLIEDIESSSRHADKGGEGSNRSPDEVKHLLHLIRLNSISSFESYLVEPVKYERKQLRKQLRFIKSATWLTEANVEFTRNEGARSLFDIKFEGGTLLFPPLTIVDGTESFLRNLIAYEQYFRDSRTSYVTDYVKFLDCLIDSSRDVEILSRFGIIENWLSNDEAVAEIFNKLTDSVIIFEDDFIYGEIFDKVEEHCSRRRNRWMANLRRNYLHSPWAIISIIAAAVLLLLTVAQTVFSGLSL